MFGIGVEADQEEFCQPARNVRVVGEGILHVVLAKGGARLAEVFAVGAQDGNFARRQPGPQNEAVKAVVLHGAAPHLGKGFLEDFLHFFGLEVSLGLVGEAKVVDPGLRGVGRFDLVRVFVHHPDAHLLQKRHNGGERELAARAVELEPQKVLRHFERLVQVHAQLVSGVQGFDLLYVRDRRAGQVVVPVAGRESVLVAVEEIGSLLLAEVLDERPVELVAPGADRLD